MDEPSMARGSVSQWLGGLRGGDAEAVRQLWGRYFPAMVRLAVLRGAGADAEDAALEAFWSLFRQAERFPRLRVAFAHGGGAFPITIGRIEHGFNVRPDLVAIENKINPRSYLARVDEHGAAQPARFYVDSLVHDPEALRLLCKLFGTRRIALGSDYPFPLGEAHPGELIDSMPDLAPEDKTQLLSGTAREFLRLS